MTQGSRAILLFGVLLAGCVGGGGGNSSSGAGVCDVIDGPARGYCVDIVTEVSQTDCVGIESGLAEQYFRVHIVPNQTKTTQLLITVYENRADNLGCVVDPCPALAEILAARIEMVEQGNEDNQTVSAVERARTDQGCS